MAEQDAAANQDPVDPQGAGAPEPAPESTPEPVAKADNDVADDYYWELALSQAASQDAGSLAAEVTVLRQRLAQCED